MKLKLREIAAIRPGMSVTLAPKGDEDIPIIRIKDLQDGVVLKPLDLISINRKQVERYCIGTQDVLIANRGSDFRSSIVDETVAGAVISSNLFAIRIREPQIILPDTLQAFLDSALGTEQLKAIARHSFTRLVLSAKDLENVTVNIPPMPVQKNLAKMLTSSRKLRRIQMRILEAHTSVKRKAVTEIFMEHK